MNKANFYIYVNGKEFIVEKNTTLIKLIKDLNLEKNNAYKFAKKKNLLNNNLDYEKKLSKMARAGFSYEIVREILK